MELHSVHKSFHHSHLGEEKHQMLSLNRRLETYLSRVKLLEEENSLLAKEIQTLRHSSYGALTQRRCQEDELRQARLEVDAAWRDRVRTEFEVGKLAEELQALDQQRQREAQAQAKAKTKLEQSRKELEEEQRAQIWLRERVGQLEVEMRHLIQTHQEDVAHLEATLTHSRAAALPTPAQRGNQTANLLQLGQEYSQRANRAWQEAAQAYQGQLARLEESLNQARNRLTQVGQEKSESQLRLQALEREIVSAQDVRLHLEKKAALQGQKHSQEIQQLQEHLEGLEAEKEELGQRIDCILMENRGLLQVKMSLSLEVATYRALLDGEGFRGDVSLSNQPRNISLTDAVFSPRGVTKNYQPQLSASPKTTSLSSVRGITGRGPTAITPIRSRKPETPMKLACEDTTKSATLETPYPKILQDGAVENFRPQEVHEKVTYAEPLSPPDEQEAPAEASQDKDGEEKRSNAGAEPPEQRPVVESVVSYQAGLSSEPPFDEEVNLFTTPNLTPVPVEKGPHAPIDAWVEEQYKGKERVQEETSDSETEAVIEPNFESRTSSPVSDYEPEEFNKAADENILKEEAVELKQQISCPVVGRDDPEDKLYPDGEEMDTWDSVIERKVDLKTDDGTEKDEEKRQHAEPEEDISTREQEGKTGKNLATDVQQDSSMMETQVDDGGQHVALDQEHAPLTNNEEDDEEEDSQNVSVSWRTELESDSYAQDNTLADTRPLIRYKSDETDANTQASHVDESESSEGEQERKAGETGTGTWNEGKTNRFGTMEDLCEEVEGEALDEEYDLGYTQTEDRGVEHGVTVSDTEESIRDVVEGHSGEETEELIKSVLPTEVDYDEELETDRLVEQELENLATDSYSAHFAQRQVNESEKTLHLQRQAVEEMMEEEEAGKPEDMSPSVEHEVRVNHKLTSSTTTADQPLDNLYFSDSSVTDAEVQLQDQEAPEKREEEDQPVSMVTEDHGLGDLIAQPHVEEISNSEETDPALQPTAAEGNLQDVAAHTEEEEEDEEDEEEEEEEEEPVPVETTRVSVEHVAEDAAGVPETAEWEVLESPGEDVEIGDRDEERDNVPESAERYLHEDGGLPAPKEEPLEISPNSVPDGSDIFVVKDSTEVSNTNGKDSDLHGFFSSGVKNDFWVSSLETAATYQPDEAPEKTNQNLGFADHLVWGNVVNGKSTMDIDPSKALAVKKEQTHSEVKQVMCRSVVEGELVHSEESDVEAESWSSGEEPV